MAKNRRTNNMRINTRIFITTILGILIPIILIASFSTVFVRTVSGYFNFSTVTTNTYSTVNQIQWAQMLSNISLELRSDDDPEERLEKVESLVKPLEKIGTLIYICENNDVLYSTDNTVLKKADGVARVDMSRNSYNYTDKGLLIVNHVEDDDASEYLLVIVNEDYTVNDKSKTISPKDFTNLLVSRTGIIVVIIALLFILSITITTLITSRTIVNPIKKIAKGADEIARGNLDYEIDYKSTNELGETVDSFNEMRLKLKESIDKQNNAIDERNVLIAGIAHDLRTPLTSAKGYTEGLIDGIANTPEMQKRYLKTICSSINDTEKILDDLLTISRLQLKGFKLNRVDMDIRDFFEDAAEEIKFYLDQNDFDFAQHINFTKPVIVSLDADAFERVIGNIVSNSVKYRRDDVRGSFKIKLNEYERTVIIELADNGIGVDRKSVPKIFDTMYRTDPARSKLADGSGLGLSVCRQMVELHGGIIWASSKEGEGLTVFISLPKKDVQK